ALYMSVLAAITTASTFLVPETRGRDLLRTEDAIGLSQTEQDTATDILAPSGVSLEDDGGHAASAVGTDDRPPASGTNWWAGGVRSGRARCGIVAMADCRHAWLAAGRTPRVSCRPTRLRTRTFQATSTLPCPATPRVNPGAPSTPAA